MKVELDLTRKEIIILTTMTNINHNIFKNLLKENPTIISCLEHTDRDVPDTYSPDDSTSLYTKLEKVLNDTQPKAPLDVYRFVYIGSNNKWTITDYYYTESYAKLYFKYEAWEKIDNSHKKIYIESFQSENSTFTADYVNKNLA